MKLVKLSPSNSAIEIYKVQQPSKAYKKLFPKRFTFALQFGSNVQSGNEHTLPLSVTFDSCIGYIFTTADLKISTRRLTDDFGNTFPVNLNQYFISAKDDYDLILEITPTHSAPAKFNESVVLRMHSTDKFDGKSVLKTIEEQFKEKITIEQFVLKIISTFPLNFFGFPVDYPKIIKTNTVNTPIKLKNLFVAYDFRPTINISHDEEVKLITTIEDMFEDKNYNVIISDNYNNLLERLTKAAKEQKIKYKLTKDSITFKVKEFRKLEFEWLFTDLI